jgi:hypothetical protein
MAITLSILGIHQMHYLSQDLKYHFFVILHHLPKIVLKFRCFLMLIFLYQNS